MGAQRPPPVDNARFPRTTAGVTPSLDHLESTVEIAIDHPCYGSIDHREAPPASPQEQAARHHHWAQERRWVYDSLRRQGASDRALSAFANCGNTLRLGLLEDELILLCNKCHNRHCQACAQEKRRSLVAAVRARIAPIRQHVRFLTLTLRCQPVPLKDQFDRLLASFRRLRQRTFWRKHCRGGIFFVELKLGENSQKWHVHLHLLVEGEFLKQPDLAAEWHAVTGDSYIVDIRGLHDDDRIASYVAKYATKPLHPNVVRSPSHLDECIAAVEGRRLVQCFGTWKGIDADSAEPAGNIVNLGTVDNLAWKAAAGDPDARRWFEAALRKWPQLTLFSPHPTNSDEEFVP